MVNTTAYQEGFVYPSHKPFFPPINDVKVWRCGVFVLIQFGA